MSLTRLAGLMIDLSEELKSEVDIVDAAALKAGDLFISEIERDGIPVYER